mmetsp:Transcript_26371/g.57835  ORF Transcript_26371/g.57835 Transcript_26371/m.57835 type:complete len:225 (+) Transcript_26371:289-963(+)
MTRDSAPKIEIRFLFKQAPNTREQQTANVPLSADTTTNDDNDQHHHISLEALPVNDGGSGLVVLLLADPHGLEGGEGGEDGTTDPHGVLALGRGHDLDLDGGGGEGGDLLGHALADSGEHGGTAREDDVGVQVLADVDVALHDGLEGGIGDAVHLEAGQVGLEEDLGTAEALVANDDDVAVGELEGLLKGGRFGGLLHLLLEVDGDEAEGFLDVADDFALGGGG